jgi:tetratricopeptide (TPR) repeat protein
MVRLKVGEVQMLQVILALTLTYFVVGSPAYAGDAEDCLKEDGERKIHACTELIHKNPRNDAAYKLRANGYAKMLDFDSAIADYNKIIEINPNDAVAYSRRGYAYAGKGDLDRSIADYNKVIEINPNDAVAYSRRGYAYNAKGNLKRGIADLNKAIEIDPTYAPAHVNRGEGYVLVGDLDRAIKDFIEGSQLDPNRASAHLGLGRAYLRKGNQDRALAELSEAMRLDAKDPEIFVERAALYEAKKQSDRAIADYQVAANLPARSPTERKAIAAANARLAALMIEKQRPKTPLAVTPTTTVSPGTRVALVIGNAEYRNAARLTNPANDARSIAASFRRLGFAEVIEKYDVDLSRMVAALKYFGDRSAKADWAVVYYSGHGIEMNGVAYLIPVDAKLERDTHVSDETVSLSRVLEKVEGARKLRLVVLDACRNNPFVSRMIRSAGVTRSVGSGLAPIEPEGGVLVAYAAKHGTTAEDGTGANSPFAEAMLANLEEPGLEINFLFRRVRDQVLASTNRRQEPFLYGSLPSESLFFKLAAPR